MSRAGVEGVTDYQQPSRRRFILQAGGGCGAIALASLLNAEKSANAGVADNPLAPRQTHFAPRARRVIWLFMHGGPSHVDLLDPKPELVHLRMLVKLMSLSRRHVDSYEQQLVAAGQLGTAQPVVRPPRQLFDLHLLFGDESWKIVLGHGGELLHRDSQKRSQITQ